MMRKSMKPESEQEKEWREVFDQFDTDHSGQIDAEELMKVFNHLDPTTVYTKEDAQELINMWDNDENGTIDFQEFSDIMKSSKQTWEEDMRDAFDAFDVDKSGSISAEEISRKLNEIGISVSYEEVQAIMAEVDTDNSGMVDFEEFKQMMAYTPKA
eukprot:c22044_g4_i1.p1 GENE.c22044_g4_i1~~c22044_g4_i1.p1  ORF type:complete len:156 (-),score=65.86 c22044_g4_i1:166-633(-)